MTSTEAEHIVGAVLVGLGLVSALFCLGAIALHHLTRKDQP